MLQPKRTNNSQKCRKVESRLALRGNQLALVNSVIKVTPESWASLLLVNMKRPPSCNDSSHQTVV